MTEHRSAEKAGEKRLREAFKALRAKRSIGVPAFERILESRSRAAASRPLAWAAAVFAVALLGALGITFYVTDRSPDGKELQPQQAQKFADASVEPETSMVQLPQALASNRWRGPLDFLLEVPGHDLLTKTPRFDVIDLSGFTTRELRRSP